MNDFVTAWQRQLLSRSNDRIEAFIKEHATNLILAFEDDTGVRLNGGRAGARLAPKALVNVFKKLTAAPSIKESGIEIHSESTPMSFENFSDSQKNATSLIQKQLSKTPRKNLIHLGGGHDHIYPLLMALQKDPHIRTQGLFIVNIDAHLDTRMDTLASSGTPFRQWAQDCEINFHLVQVGIHPFANPESNYQALVRGKMDILTGSEHEDLPQKLEMLRELGSCPGSQILVSLDADALNSSCMSAVSAVNHDGLELHQVEQIMDWAFSRCSSRMFGIYEYNPLYDDLSQKGARALVKLMNKVFI